MSIFRILEIDYSTAPTNGQAPVYDAASGTWKASAVSQTPWRSDIDAASFRLDNLGGLELTASDTSIQNALLVEDTRVSPPIADDDTFATMQISSTTTPSIDCSEANALNLFTLLNDPLNTSINAYGIVGSAFMVDGDANFLAALNFNAGTADELLGSGSSTLQSCVAVSNNMISVGGDIVDGGIYDGNILVLGATGSIATAYAFRCATNMATNPWAVLMGDFPSNFLGQISIGDASFYTAVPTSVGLNMAGTTRVLRLNRLTTAQRDALTASDGMVILNTTTSKFQGYVGGWVDFH